MEARFVEVATDRFKSVERCSAADLLSAVECLEARIAPLVADRDRLIERLLEKARQADRSAV